MSIKKKSNNTMESKVYNEHSVPDSELLSRVIDGDLAAFDVLVDRYKARLLNFVFRFIGDKEVAEDIVQETFLRAYRKRTQYEAIANFSTWLFTIAGNLAKTELRRRKRWRLLSLDWNDETQTGFDIADESYRPDRVIESELIQWSIQRAIDSLPLNYKQVVILRDIDGMSYQDIAKIVGCPVGTVKSRVNRGRLRLQKKLKAEGKDIGIDF